MNEISIGPNYLFKNIKSSPDSFKLRVVYYFNDDDDSKENFVYSEPFMMKLPRGLPKGTLRLKVEKHLTQRRGRIY
jgi:hypothetical protein